MSVITGDKALLPTFKSVITLDTDTQLPRASAQRLAAAMAHPLNRPIIDAKKGRVVAGYGVLEPRVGITLSSSRQSWFSRVNSSDAGIDPYTRAVSDVYQDLFGEGSFVGKGIYDVDAFEETCGHRFPENRILSHDLIEGSYARSGLLTDVTVFEDYPSRHNVDERRRHRWLRGDWQIGGWLMPRVPGANNHGESNTLSALSRWKIFDNLRRSVIAPALLGFLAASWFAFPEWAWVASVSIVILAFVPALNSSLREVFSRDMTVPWRMHFYALRNNAVRNGTQAILSLVFMVSEALLSVDAILRTFGTGWRPFTVKSPGATCLNGRPPAIPSTKPRPLFGDFYASGVLVSY